MTREPTNLEELLDRIAESAADGDRVALGTIVEAVGRRSFGSLLLLAGLIALSPLSGIPGMPTSMGVLVLLIAGQMLLHRKHFWLPRWLLDRSLKRERLSRALAWLRGPARRIDRWLRPRLSLLVGEVGVHLIAVVCIVIAAGMPIMEVVPFSATGAGAALAAFGLALITRDGLLALLGWVAVATVLGATLHGVR